MGSVALPYSDPFGVGLPRPYLALRLTGLNGTQHDVFGILDSGADTSQLPAGFAALMGYSDANLATVTVATAGEPAEMQRATEPCGACVLGLPDCGLSLMPTFGGPIALWGRTDFMATFDVAIYQKRGEFTLDW